MSTQRPSRIVYSTLDVKHWMQAPPSIDAARPGSCPSCGAASRPPGCALGLHGHGLRTRQLRGPVAVDGPLTTQVLTYRRCRCTRCRIVLTVVPRHRHYGTAAIALAFALALHQV